MRSRAKKHHRKAPSLSNAFTNYSKKSSSLTNMVSPKESRTNSINIHLSLGGPEPFQLNNSGVLLEEYTYSLRPGSKANTFECSPAARKRSQPTKISTEEKFSEVLSKK